MGEITVKCRVQRSLVVAHVAEDDGDMVFVICRRGLEKVLNKRLAVGQKLTLKINLQDITENTEAQT